MNKLIYLAGFMTSGKSTIGPILANVLGWNFFDLDAEIEKLEQSSVVEIFQNSGEEYFRSVETSTLRKFSQMDKVVISLGGGTLTSEQNLEIIKSSGKMVYLHVNAENIYKRIKNKIDRPLFREMVLEESPKEHFIEKIEKYLKEREKYYLQADIILDTDQERVGITVDKLAKEINRIINGTTKF